MSSNTKNRDDVKLIAPNSPIEPKISFKKTYESILERRGYKLTCTIGKGSYAKVKLG
jgi:hypothetical protein